MELSALGILRAPGCFKVVEVLPSGNAVIIFAPVSAVDAFRRDWDEWFHVVKRIVGTTDIQ